MVRRKKHVVNFPWSAALKVATDRYRGKWVEGPIGKLYVSSVYPSGGDNEFATLVYGNEKFDGGGLKILVKELESDYRIIERPPKNEHYLLAAILRMNRNV